MDSGGTSVYQRDGVGVTSAVLTDSSATYTPGISERRSGASKFFHSDRLGTNVAETNSSQSVTATKTYDAFGLLTSTTGSSASPFGFVGQQGYQEDNDSGLKLLGHRYYDPSTGRFLTRDPAKDGRNWYEYCANNPLRAVDPSGHNWWWFYVRLGLALLRALWQEGLPGGGTDPTIPQPPTGEPGFWGKVRRALDTAKDYAAAPGGGEVASGATPAGGALMEKHYEKANNQVIDRLSNGDSSDFDKDGPHGGYDTDNDTSNRKILKDGLKGLR